MEKDVELQADMNWQETQKEEVTETVKQEHPDNIWLQFNTVSVGWDDGKPTATYNIHDVFNGLVALGHAVSVNFPNPELEENATDDIEEVAHESKTTQE